MRAQPCLLMLTAVSCLFAADPPSVTVLVDFEMPPSELSYSAMQKETEAAFLASGRKVMFKLKSDVAAGETFEDVVLMSFDGKCKMDAMPVLFDERGPLAFTRTVNGDVQPFGVVRCDRIRKALQRAMWGRDYKEGDQLMGRAMGRVVAHELYHMLGKTRDHCDEGVARKELSGKALLSEKLDFKQESLDKLKAHAGGSE